MVARELTAAEIDELSTATAAGIPLPGDAGNEERTYTEAELALLEQEEGFVVEEVVVDERAFENVEGTLHKMLRTPGGKALSIKMEDNTASSETVNIYDAKTGQPTIVSKAAVKFYLDKTRDGQRVFLPRQSVKMPPRPYPCPADECTASHGRKMFATQIAADEHFEGRHHAEFIRRERVRDRTNEDRANLMNENLAKMLQIAVGGKTDLTPDEIKTLAEASTIAGMGNVPDQTWTRSKIMGWMNNQRERWYGPEHASMTKDELLIHIGALEAVAV